MTFRQINLLIIATWKGAQTFVSKKSSLTLIKLHVTAIDVVIRGGAPTWGWPWHWQK